MLPGQRMTDSLTRTLRRFGAPELVERYSLASRDFDELFQGAMFMTEQAAGSDVARTRTVAREQGGEWKLYGDKWFCSTRTPTWRWSWPGPKARRKE